MNSFTEKVYAYSFFSEGSLYVIINGKIDYVSKSNDT